MTQAPMTHKLHHAFLYQKFQLVAKLTEPIKGAEQKMFDFMIFNKYSFDGYGASIFVVLCTSSTICRSL